MSTFRILLISSLLLSFVNAISPAEERSEVNNDSEETLQMLYKEHPGAKIKISNSYGYATFSSFGINLLFFSAEGGSGVAVNNKTKKRIYMNMASGGVGVGLGVKDFRAIFLFENKEVFNSFVNNGWEANAQADAAAKANKKGGAIEGSVTVQPGIKLYKLTKNGLAIQATIQATKYWKDDDLN
jgi:lipid-binding SYLF domain-containing protein